MLAGHPIVHFPTCVPLVESFIVHSLSASPQSRQCFNLDDSSREPLVSDKRKKRKFAAKREQRRLKEEQERLIRLANEGRLVNGVELPLGAVAADRSQQVPNNSYSPPPDFYIDIEFTCKDCGSQEVWTAEQQKWYYEVAKGSLYARAVRCRQCRNNIKDQAEPQRRQAAEADQPNDDG